MVFAEMGDVNPARREAVRKCLAVGWAAVHLGEAQPGVILFREIAPALYQRDYADPP